MTRLAVRAIVNLGLTLTFPYDESVVPVLTAFQITSVDGVVLRRGVRVQVSTEKNDMFWLGKSRARRGRGPELFPLFDEGFPLHHRHGSIISPVPEHDFARWVALLPPVILRSIQSALNLSTPTLRDVRCAHEKRVCREVVHAPSDTHVTKKRRKKKAFTLLSLTEKIPYPFPHNALAQYVAFSLQTASGQVLRRGFRFRISETEMDVYYLGKSRAAIVDGIPDLHRVFEDDFPEQHRMGCTLNPIPEDDLEHWVTLLPKNLQEILHRMQNEPKVSKRKIKKVVPQELIPHDTLPVHEPVAAPESLDEDDEPSVTRVYSPPHVWPPRKYRCRVAVDRLTNALRSIFPDYM